MDLRICMESEERMKGVQWTQALSLQEWCREGPWPSKLGEQEMVIRNLGAPLGDFAGVGPDGEDPLKGCWA